MQNIPDQPQSQFPQTPSPISPAQAQPGLKEQQLKLVHNAAGSNFYSIALFSLINSVINYFQGKLYFPIGLGITQIIDFFSHSLQQDAPQAKTMFLVFGIVLNLFIIGIVALFGFTIKKQITWLIPVGGILYLLDGLLLLLFQDWIGAGFHAYFLFRIWTNWQAIRGFSKSIMPPSAITPM